MNGANGTARQRVLVVGLDAATFDLVLPWVESGDLPTISAVLGHASPESTNLYMSVDRERLLECVLDLPNGPRS